MRRLASVAVLALLLVACSDGTKEGSATVHRISTPSLSWLTVERLERLADIVESIRHEHGWAAGCVFRHTADETIFEEFDRPTGTAAYSFVADPDLAPAVVMFVEGDVKGTGNYREHIPDAVSFCCVAE